MTALNVDGNIANAQKGFVFAFSTLVPMGNNSDFAPIEPWRFLRTQWVRK